MKRKLEAGALNNCDYSICKNILTFSHSRILAFLHSRILAFY